MELADAVRRRRMVRSFRPNPIPAGSVERILDHARRVPSAGFAQGFAYVVLEGPDETSRYWDATLPTDRRADFPWPGLLLAPVLVIPCVDPDAYIARYSEPDKARTRLGTSLDAWKVPYWFVDAGMSAMTMLLSVVDEGLGACFFGLFEHEAAVKQALGIPAAIRPAGAVAIGYPADDRPSRSTQRGRRPLGDVVHRGGW